MPILFLIASLVAIGFHWGGWYSAGIVAFILAIPSLKSIDTLEYAMFKYLLGVVIWIFGVIAVTALLGNIWGAAMAIVIAIHEIITWNK